MNNKLNVLKIKKRKTPLHVSTVFVSYLQGEGHAVAQLALCYKPECRGFDSHVIIGIYDWHNPSGRTMALGSNQPVTQMSTWG
jgi:hypothetical protein